MAALIVISRYTLDKNGYTGEEKRVYPSREEGSPDLRNGYTRFPAMA